MTSDKVTHTLDDLDTVSAHHEVPIAVTAWIDEGVVPLVEGLCAVPGIETVQSCEEFGSDGLAHVWFASHDPSQLPRRIAEMLTVASQGGSEASVSVRWVEDGTLLADLSCEPAAVPSVARVLHQLVPPVAGGQLMTRDAQNFAVR